MDAGSWLGLGLWIAALVVAGLGSAATAAADTARGLEAEYFTVERERVRRLSFWGAALNAVGIAGVAVVSVIFVARAGYEIWVAAICSAASVLIANYFQKVTRDLTHARFKNLAHPLLGEGAALLPSEDGAPSTEPVEQVVDAAEKAGLIEMDEHQMIHGIIHLDRTPVRDIMVPRIDVIAIDASRSFRDALDIVVANSLSRAPLYEESIDHIVGVLYAKDLLRAMRDSNTPASIRTLARPAHFVPESKPVDDLLQELQKTKVHLAIVVDEYGGTAGIVTIEDILEEIVGEIQDEYDTSEEPLVKRVNDNESEVNARATIAQVNEAMELKLPDESETLGGLVLMRLEKMPKVGDHVSVDGVTLTVLNMAGRRIRKVGVKKNVVEET